MVKSSSAIQASRGPTTTRKFINWGAASVEAFTAQTAQIYLTASVRRTAEENRVSRSNWWRTSISHHRTLRRDRWVDLSQSLGRANFASNIADSARATCCREESTPA